MPASERSPLRHGRPQGGGNLLSRRQPQPIAGMGTTPHAKEDHGTSLPGHPRLCFRAARGVHLPERKPESLRAERGGPGP